MWVSGDSGRLTVSVSIPGSMAIGMRASSRSVLNTVKAWRDSITETSTRVYTLTVNLQASASTTGPMVATSKACSNPASETATEYGKSHMEIATSTKESTFQTKSQATVSLPGQVGTSTKATTRMTPEMTTVRCIG